MSSMEQWRQKAVSLLNQHAFAHATLRRARRSLKQAKQEERDCAEAQAILQQVAQLVQEKAHERITGVVSMCLASVFTNPYTFHIKFERKRGKTEARLYFMRDGYEFSSADHQVEGGVLDVAAFALRLSCLVLTQPPLRRVLILDEPFRNVNGKGNRERVRKMLQTLPGKLGVQIIMSTGYPWLYCGRVIDLGGE
jgi:hypothetical protein